MQLSDVLLLEDNFEEDVPLCRVEFYEVRVDEDGNEINEATPIRKRVRRNRRWKIRYFCPKGFRHQRPPGKKTGLGRCVKIPPAKLAKMARLAKRGAKRRAKKAARTRKMRYGK